MALSECFGIYQGFVKRVNDPEKRGRVRCTIPELLGKSAISDWCEPIVPVAFDYGGDFYIPPVGEAVWLFFIEGDIDRPAYIGGWWSENATPLKKDYSKASETRIINYAGCTIKMCDGKISIGVSDNSNELTIENKKITINGDLVINGTIIQN